MGKMEQEKEKEIVKAEFQKIDIEKEQIVSIFSSILNYMNQKNILNLYNDYYNHFDQQERKIEKVAVLKDGEIIGEGIHNELIESSPVYKEIIESQLVV